MYQRERKTVPTSKICGSASHRYSREQFCDNFGGQRNLFTSCLVHTGELSNLFPSALRYAVQQGSRAREAGGCELKTFRAKDRRPRNLCWSFIPNFTVILTCLEKVMIVKSRIGLGGREAIEARDESDLNFFPIAASTATHQELSLSNLISDLKSQAK